MSSGTTSLSRFVLLWKSPLVVVSSPELGLDEKGTYTAPVMNILEQLSSRLKPEFTDHFNVAVDFSGSSSAHFCDSRIRYHDRKSDRDILGKEDFHSLSLDIPDEEKRKAIRNSFWYCTWCGQVSGALKTAAATMGDVPLPAWKEAETVLGSQVGQGGFEGVYPSGLFLNGNPGKTTKRVVVAVSIDGGIITQVEKENIPKLCKRAMSDLMRRGYKWASEVNIAWAHFATVKDMLDSLAGVPNLTFDYDTEPVGFDGMPTQTKWCKDGPSKRPLNYKVARPRSQIQHSPSLLNVSVDEALRPGASVSVDSYIMAASEGDVDAVQFMLRKGISVNASDGKAIRRACTGNFQTCLKVLLENRGDPNLLDKAYHETALGCAIDEDSAGCVRLLLEYRADLNVLTQKKTPLEYAQSKTASSEILSMLGQPSKRFCFTHRLCF
eukprot:TRINITY_DN6974_c0_g1_i1.p1 TRINITY_DN6974_c0_g1~~TRINITY_DN6974_c0_g1_i1.p1  ORF type:complete len:438 (+),score=47.82 TRINITY_DN6974_c0_g1_i1:87-1400(+)